MGGSRGEQSGSLPSCRLIRNDAAIITFVEDTLVDVLGWQPEDLIGKPSTDFIHPDDQASAVGAWFEMCTKPGETTTWRGRYRNAAGHWQWIETQNTNFLEDERGVVETTMCRVEANWVSTEEQLRARQQLLSRLADALPVGLVHFDIDREITFTNDRLFEILGVPPAATCEAQFAGVVPDDLPLLQIGLETVLSDQAVDNLELRFLPRGLATASDRTRVCHLSLRPLTDEEGNVTGAIGCVSDVTESVELRRELEFRAAVDGTTGCMNRRATMELLDITLGRNEVTRGGVGVIFIDIDNFKSVNDDFGHAAGDAVLVEASERARKVIRGQDRLGRIGGDEFLIVCPQVTTSAKALEVGERVCRALRGPVQVGDDTVQLQASVGVAWSDEAVSADYLVAEADRAMYRSKRDGRGRLVISV